MALPYQELRLIIKSLFLIFIYFIMKYFFTIFLFSYGFLVTFNDLPKVSFLSYESRIGILLLGLAFGIFFLLKKKLAFLYYDRFSCFFPLIVYTALSSVFISTDRGRSLGFFIWLLLNIALVCGRFSWAGIGFLVACLCGSIHILLQTYAFDWVYSPATLYNYTFNETIIRPFSLWGEPSYAVLNLSVFYMYFEFYKSNNFIKHSVQFLAALAILMTFSRGGLCCIAFFILFRLIRVLQRKERFFTMGYFIIPLLIYFFHVKYVDKLISKNQTGNAQAVKVALVTKGSENQRLISIKRGIQTFKNHPWLGVGIGNSGEYIKKNKIRSDLNSSYQGLHNIFLEMICELGLVGFFIYIYSFYLYFKKNKRENLYLFVFTMFVPMSFCQNINMPTTWLTLTFSQKSFKNKKLECPH